MRKFKFKLKEIIDESGLSKTEFANRHNVTRGVIYNMLNGQAPALNFIQQLIRVDPKIDLNWLLRDDYESPNSPSTNFDSNKNHRINNSDWGDYIKMIEIATRKLKEIAEE